MIARLLDYLIHGRQVNDYVNLANPYTVEKLTIGEYRMFAELWSCVWYRYSRDPVVERRERKVAAMRSPVVAWRKRA